MTDWSEKVETRALPGNKTEEVRFQYWQCPRCPFGTVDPDYATGHALTHPPLPEPEPEPVTKSKEK